MESESIIEVEPVDLVQEETSNTVVQMALYQLQIMRKYRKVSKFSGTRKLRCNLPKTQTKKPNHREFH